MTSAPPKVKVPVGRERQGLAGQERDPAYRGVAPRRAQRCPGQTRAPVFGPTLPAGQGPRPQGSSAAWGGPCSPHRSASVFSRTSGFETPSDRPMAEGVPGARGVLPAPKWGFRGCGDLSCEPLRLSVLEADLLPGAGQGLLRRPPAARHVLPGSRGSAPGLTTPRTQVVTCRFEDVGDCV